MPLELPYSDATLVAFDLEPDFTGELAFNVSAFARDLQGQRLSSAPTRRMVVEVGEFFICGN